MFKYIHRAIPVIKIILILKIIFFILEFDYEKCYAILSNKLQNGIQTICEKEAKFIWSFIKINIFIIIRGIQINCSQYIK